MIARMMSLGHVSVEQKFHSEAFPADGTSVQAGRVAGQVKLQLQLRIAADPTENASRHSIPSDAGCRRWTPSNGAAIRHCGRSVDVPDMIRHLRFAPEEASTLPRRVSRRVLIIGHSARIAPIDPALLTVLHSEVNLYRYSGVKSVPTQSASVQMVRVAVEQVPLQEVRMRVQLLAGSASILLADLTQIMLRQMRQHVLPVLETGFAFRTGMPHRIVPMISL